MRTITEQQIIALAPNPNAVANARKISSAGGVVSRMRSEDDTFYMGECKGSGKSGYIVSADFMDSASPVLRCSCPSRQFPCKHCLALLFEIAGGKAFVPGEIPDDIIKKREKKETREAKKAEKAQAAGIKAAGDSDAENKAAGNAAGSKAAANRARSGKAARVKKIQKQLEGLELTGKLVENLIYAGLSAMGGVSLKTYRDLAKQLGDYYLPGPQAYLNRLILEMETYQRDQNRGHYGAAVEVLKRLHTLDKKAAAYLNEKLKNDTPEADDDILYEELGGIWKLDQLNALGLKKENVSLLQLAFQVIYEEAKKEFTDIGWWVDVDTGEVVSTRNYRPIKALKYIRQEDSCFARLRIPVMSCYPGALNRRVRWDAAVAEIPDRGVYEQVKRLASPDIATAVKTAKNQIKNILSDDFCAMLLPYERIGTVRTESGEHMVMEDQKGSRIIIRSRDPERLEAQMLARIPDAELLKNQVLFGMVYYDTQDRSMCIAPLSIVTEDRIVRLLY